MNDLQRGIVRAVSVMLFENVPEAYKEEPFSYRCDRNRHVVITRETEDDFGYNLSIKKIDDKYYFEVWSNYYDEYDQELTKVFGYVPFDTDRKKMCYHTARYSHLIECIIENS